MGEYLNTLSKCRYEGISNWLEVEPCPLIHLLHIVECVSRIWIIISEACSQTYDEIAPHNLFKVEGVEGFSRRVGVEV